MWPRQTLAHREINIPGAFKKDYNAKLPQPAQFDFEMAWQDQQRQWQKQEELRAMEPTVPNQLPAEGFGLPGSSPSYVLPDETPTAFDWTARVKMFNYYG